jgi:hypothetical protein
VIDEWKRIPIILNLQRVVDGGTINNLMSFIVLGLVDYGCLSEMDIANKLVCFRANEVIIFHGIKFGVPKTINAKTYYSVC